jgi:exodeoxyribonuclease-3
MKVMYLNILEGSREKERFEKIIRFVNSENPDILGLSELKDWDKNDYEKLKEFQKKTNYKNSVFCKCHRGFHLALFSNQDFLEQKTIADGFVNGFIRARLMINNEPMVVILTHLHYVNEDLRLKELEIIQQNIGNDENIILMGDMNSLSPLDNYDENQLLDFMRKIGIDKFGKEKIRRDAITKIMDMGFVDIVKQFSKSFEYSVPSLYNRDKDHFTKLRLDYIFANKQIADKVTKAKIIRNDITNQLSDHFPVVAEINI